MYQYFRQYHVSEYRCRKDGPGGSVKKPLAKPLAEVFRIIDGGTHQTARDPMEMAVEQNKNGRTHRELRSHPPRRI